MLASSLEPRSSARASLSRRGFLPGLSTTRSSARNGPASTPAPIGCITTSCSPSSPALRRHGPGGGVGFIRFFPIWWDSQVGSGWCRRGLHALVSRPNSWRIWAPRALGGTTVAAWFPAVVGVMWVSLLSCTRRTADGSRSRVPVGAGMGRGRTPIAAAAVAAVLLAPPPFPTAAKALSTRPSPAALPRSRARTGCSWMPRDHLRQRPEHHFRVR